MAAAALAVLLLVVITATRSRPAPLEMPEMVLSDSTPDPRAVGMCARNRSNGVVEGEIVGLVRTAGSEKLQFRVQSREHAGAEYVMAAAAVQVVKCEDETAFAVGAETNRRRGR